MKRTRLPKNPPTLEQALAIKKITTWKEFSFVNHWRHHYINKQFSELDPAKWDWKYDRHPGLKEETERLLDAALSPEEHTHLAYFEKLLGEFDAHEVFMGPAK